MALERFIFVQPSTNDWIKRWGIDGSPIGAYVPVAGITQACLSQKLQVDFLPDDGAAEAHLTGPLTQTIVGITALTPTANRASEIARRVIENGGRVIIGGMDPSARTDWWLKEAQKIGIETKTKDRVTIIPGEIEGGSLAQALQAADAGRPFDLFYKTAPTDLTNIPLPSQETIKEITGAPYQRVSNSRGCPNKCEYCSVHLTAGLDKRVRPYQDVISELKARDVLNQKEHQVTWTDDYFGGSGTIELLKKIVENGHHFPQFIQPTIEMGRNAQMWELLNSIGPTLAQFGLESPNRNRLISAGVKSGKQDLDPIAIFNTIREKNQNIAIGLNFMIGTDSEPLGKERFDELEAFIDACKPDRVIIGKYTPFPGTLTAKKLQEQGRIFDFNTDHYDGEHWVMRIKGRNIKGDLVDENTDEVDAYLDPFKARLNEKVALWSRLRDMKMNGFNVFSGGYVI